MSRGRRLPPWLLSALAVLAAVVGLPLGLALRAGGGIGKSAWLQTASPGQLSSAHASLATDCAACHTPGRGVEASSCVVCHATETSLLQRQPTAFHASIGDCTACHPEHRGSAARPTRMDHAGLARIGLRQLAAGSDEAREQALRLTRWAKGGSDRTAARTLDCSACHANDDRHLGLFGPDCAACHATDRWTIPRFVHPPASSRDCSQCHQAPPSHYMMHFKMISQRVAGRHDAPVSACHACHQTTSWNDIRRVGIYKHH